MDKQQILILVLSLVAGIVGTGLGGIIGVLLKNKGNKVMGRVLSFAGGVMVGVVTFEMLPEAVEYSKIKNSFEQSGILIAVSALVVGMLIIFGLNKMLDVIENMRGTHKSIEELHHETKVIEANDALMEANACGDTAAVQAVDKKSLLKAGLIMLLAIAFHNLPEGMAIGASGASNSQTGILVAIIIAVHNIPEGMAISAPLASGGVKGWKTILLTALAGAATVVGALIGLAVGGISRLASGICMGLAGGAMLYVTFCEILPQSILIEEGRVPAVSMLVGIVCSMVFVFAF
ncbi:MAG: ZIP family metal transporter [Christensenella sp.]|nr:MAG: ZIP family metal transporter [Christensenella sp.]